MDECPIRDALRRDADLLLALSPQPDSTALWDAVRRARAARLRRIADICGWSFRALGAASALGIGLAAPGALPLLAGPLILAGWLSIGICTPILARAPGAR